MGTDLTKSTGDVAATSRSAAIVVFVVSVTSTAARENNKFIWPSKFIGPPWVYKFVNSTAGRRCHIRTTSSIMR
ncbi:uncharacterized protein PRCAT00004505001 [Priceomyces carsonii]|uniref:uncharacterized protein n=1 Tax=Priceomyces carsonii TaxID=28549 RepID=UPI002EDBB757|nr:unnamed protein product [Priceomyces carsonii]